MRNYKTLILVPAIFLALFVTKVAAAGTCHVTNSSASAASGTLLNKLYNQPGGPGDDTCSTIVFDISGTIDVPGQIVIGPNVTVDGANKVTLRPSSGFTQNVADGCFVRMIPDLNDINATTGGSGISTLKRIKIDAYNRVNNGVCVYSDSNAMDTVEVYKAKVNGILFKGNDSMILLSKLHDNAEGILVDGGAGFYINSSTFWSNTGIGIELKNNGNNNYASPENLTVFTGKDGRHIILVKTPVDADQVQYFRADTDGREGAEYKGYFFTTGNASKNAQIGGKLVTAFRAPALGLDAIDVVATTMDLTTNSANYLNTSRFSMKAKKFKDDTVNIDDCFADLNLDAFAADPNADPCGNEPPPPCDTTQTCAEIQNDIASGTCTQADHDACCANQTKRDDSCDNPPSDQDGDGVPDVSDNCPTTPNTNQADSDNDGVGNVCDNCPNNANPNQADSDGDGLGDVCDPPSPPVEDCFYDKDFDDKCDTTDEYIHPSYTGCNFYYNEMQDPGSTPAEIEQANTALLNCCGQSAHQGDDPDDSICKNLACVANFFFAVIFHYDNDFDGVHNNTDNCASVANGPCEGPNNQLDSDFDGVGDVCDNCPFKKNADQADIDGDGYGDVCDDTGGGTTIPPELEDFDGDGVLNKDDNCRLVPNPDQLDTDGDAANGYGGDACDDDRDGDTIPNVGDNCALIANTDQSDKDGDGLGDLCDPVTGAILNIDVDGDGVDNMHDNCILVPNASQLDSDNNGIGDACQIDALIPSTSNNDFDGDGILDHQDNCPTVFNKAQGDIDNDGVGDPCDIDDIDGDKVLNWVDNCPAVPNENQDDADNDGIGDACEAVPNPLDLDQDGKLNDSDNCMLVPNADQSDVDGDGVGDVCDSVNDLIIIGILDGISDNVKDLDLDGVDNNVDNCPITANSNQADADFDGIGDACEGLVYSGDLDGDGIPDTIDNCITVRNPDQADSNGHMDGVGFGDACEAEVSVNINNTPLYDIDGDLVPNFDTDNLDNCPFTVNPSQMDSDGDGIGDACDIDMIYLDPEGDLDGDNVRNAEDNCPAFYNPDQADNNGRSDGDGIGDVCELIVNVTTPDPNTGSGTSTGGDAWEIAGGANKSGCSLVAGAAAGADSWILFLMTGLPLAGLVIRRKRAK